MDSFFAKGFKASKCKTLLKLTIPRIKLLRNRREIQIKQMRRDIAKLLETGQEATARIRVEHIIREEKMMAAQEIVELFCELIAVRLPIIEVQKECPLDLKEAISSVCFAAPRCADLQELQQVQMLFAGKYGKDFVSAATELRPECGVNRQLIELLSIRAPSPDIKLKVLKEIAEEHELDWDPSASETELLKTHEDLLNGPSQFVSGSKVPLPDEKLEVSHVAPESASVEVFNSEDDFDSLNFPEVPKQPVKSSPGTAAAPEMLPFPASALSDDEFESSKPYNIDDGLPNESQIGTQSFSPETMNQESESAHTSAHISVEKPFLPFIPPLSQAAASVPSDKSIPTALQTENSLPGIVKQESESPLHSVQKSEEKQYVPFSPPTPQSVASIPSERSDPIPLRTKSEVTVDLQDVLAAAQAAADSAERAAAAARSAASLAQLRISELAQKKNEGVSEPTIENPFFGDTETWEVLEKPHVGDITPRFNGNDVLRSPSPHHKVEDTRVSDIPSYDDAEAAYKSSVSSSHMHNPDAHQQFQRLPSMDDDPYSYPSLFTSDGSRSFTEDPRYKSGQ